MRTYARIEEQRVVEIVSLNVVPSVIYHPALEWIDITSLSTPPEIGYIYSNGAFSAPVKKSVNDALIATMKFTLLIEEATKKITPLQDAVDIGIATEDEVERLGEWKKYRVLLSRIDIESGSEIQWPDKPAL